jgi:hypothetical protein
MAVKLAATSYAVGNQLTWRIGSQSGIDSPARFHRRSNEASMCAAKWPRIQHSWMQCAPITPSPAASADSNAIARSRSDRARNGR